MKTDDRLAERTIDIYLQVAENARLSGDSHLTDSMLLAAHEQITSNSNNCTITARTLTRLAELLTMQNHLCIAEETFTLALSCAKQNCANSWLLARIQDGLTEVYIQFRDFKKARKQCRQAVRIISKTTGCDSTLLLSRKRKLALLDMLLGNDIGPGEVAAYLKARLS
ncbi:MAG: hypothetical protein JST44_08300 [Cyanobacteria bacterium SZAS LIN-5]|nr:hypothetical protein [Cyanobacteria bacterium SZAS LIN-5]